MARPLKPIDAEQVFKLAQFGCTQKQIAEFFGCHPDTIRESFSGELSRARAGWEINLRRAQAIRAIRDRSDTMLIHLGKSYLGQTEKLEISTKQKPTYIHRAHNPRDQQISVSTNGNGHAGNNGDTGTP